MAVVIRYRCQRCGARWEGGGSQGAWVRCGSCRALVDFDGFGFFESPAYAEFLQKGAQAAATGWPRYQAALAEADALAARGDQAGALEKMRGAVALLSELTPFTFPPEAATDARYRKELFDFQAWWLLQSRTDPTVSALQREIEATFRAVDYRAPLPTL